MLEKIQNQLEFITTCISGDSVGGGVCLLYVAQ